MVLLAGFAFSNPIPIEAASLPAAPGVYVMALRTRSGDFRPIYVGQSENLGARVAAHHERWSDWQSLADFNALLGSDGAIYVATHLNPDPARRDVAEIAVYARFRPQFSRERPGEALTFPAGA